MLEIVKISGFVKWTAEQDPESGMWWAECTALGLNAWGETEELLAKCMEEGLDLLVSRLAKTDRLREFMEARGFRVVVEPVTPTSPVGPPVTIRQPASFVELMA